MEGEIAQLGEEILRGPTREVDKVDNPEVERVIQDLLDTVGPAKGVGIAANQIRSDLRIFVMASHPNERYPYAPHMEPTALINPVLLAHSEEKAKDWEGCLSVGRSDGGKSPTTLRALVPRWVWVEVEYTDIKGQRTKTKFEGFLARIFQHEIDHLNGMVYLDRVDSNRDIYSNDVFLKLIEKRKSEK